MKPPIIALVLLLCAAAPQSLAVEQSSKKTATDQLSVEKKLQNLEETVINILNDPGEKREERALEYLKKNSGLLKHLTRTELPQSAIFGGHTTLALYLIEQNIFDESTIDVALLTGNVPVVQKLLNREKGPKKDLYNRALSTLMQLIESPQRPFTGEQIRNNHLIILQMLIDGGADVNIKSKKALGTESNTPLELATEIGDTQIVEYLLSKGAPANPPDNMPLIKAIMKNNLELIKLLVSKGARVNQPSITALKQPGMTETITETTYPLVVAAGRFAQNQNIVAYLIEKGADVNAVSSITGTPLGTLESTALGTAIIEGNETIAKLLLQKGAKSDKEVWMAQNPRSTENRTEIFHKIPITHIAAYNLMPNLVAYLFAHGVSATTRNAQGMTLLHMTWYPKGGPGEPTFGLSEEETVAQLKQVTAVLLKNGVDINAKDNNGNTALHYVVEFARPETIIALLDFKPDPTIKNKLGKTALDLAREKNSRADIIKRLEELAKK